MKMECLVAARIWKPTGALLKMSATAATEWWCIADMSVHEMSTTRSSILRARVDMSLIAEVVTATAPLMLCASAHGSDDGLVQDQLIHHA